MPGTKIFCTNAAVADFVIVAAKTAHEGGHRGLGLFVVERGTPGFVVCKSESKLGACGVPSSELRFDGAFVPEANRLGSEHDGFKAVMEAFNRSRPIIGARGVGGRWISRPTTRNSASRSASRSRRSRASAG